jgi:hypothetical protein
MRIKESEKKLAELILYISRKSAGDPRFGAIKLSKLLCFCDFFAFGLTGRSITEAEYQHLENGPAPKRLRPVRKELERQGDLHVEHVPLKSGNEQIRTVALREAELSQFSGAEIALIDNVIDRYWDDDADSIIKRSHDLIGWRATKLKETIPLNSILVSDAPLSPAEIERGRELAEQFGWMGA